VFVSMCVFVGELAAVSAVDVSWVTFDVVGRAGWSLPHGLSVMLGAGLLVSTASAVNGSGFAFCSVLSSP
ncbi:hypothetical protein, partial [Xylella fastidiosa]|uniref:hypothetical protein n=1 Tax=Xylella fastidiosa TaxID=2371 RepID=UPI001EEB7F27